MKKIMQAKRFFSTTKITLKLPLTMKAVGFYEHLQIDDPRSLQDVVVSLPELEKSEVLVNVKAIGMNPIDTIVRGHKPQGTAVDPEVIKILGFDGAGVVVDKHESVSDVNIRDDVYFISDLRKNGTNAEFVAVNEFLMARKPSNLNYEEAAAMPLVSLTAYDCIYNRLKLSPNDQGSSLLIINSSGGVGAVAIQIAKNLGLKVIGTGGRPETVAFSRKFGADLVLDHKEDLLTQLKKAGIKSVDNILVNYDPFPYWKALVTAVKPFGKICTIVESSEPVDISLLKDKSVALLTETMFTRLKYDVPDKTSYKSMLNNISKLIESGKLYPIVSKVMSPINADNLREAHRIMESHKMVGKLVLSGF